MANLILVLEKELSDQQRYCILELERQCFSDVDPEEVEECFYAESFARILAYDNDELVGCLKLHKRNIEFDEKEILVGGAVGACVAAHMRGKGIGIRLMKNGLTILKKHNCDVACLNADPINCKISYELYKKLGFRLMRRKISFEDKHGNIRYDTGTMFTHLNSKELFDHIMNSKKTFYYGKGYW